MKSVYVVGDIHGKIKMLEDLLDRIKGHLALRNATDSELVFVGDYVDRGEDSAGVLKLVRELVKNPAPFSKVVALTGNHEVMMIDAIDGVDDTGMWLYNGGKQTIESFTTKGEDWAVYASSLNLKNLIGYPMIKWVRELPVYYELGKIAVSHAGIDNELLPASAHNKDSLIWSRRMRVHAHSIYDYTVHGHTPMKAALVETHVAYIDTGAVFGGPLTALYFPDVENPLDGKEVLQVVEVR